ncbi:TadE/TadG family type IV pilus assembly protein [Aurantiacibacter suaedae]|uniref:TadE/TadG family type IV pilus assembly protein n=1 Tax=Aurantiacibacter suaedae TaxID=2545755 RepID=UPI0010F9F762|nr:TadE/TadG family type IV pilus assembly protein [Aurantiacibacter suaedae]
MARPHDQISDDPSFAHRRRSLLRDCSGAAAVEFAIVGTAFIALLMATLHLMMIYLAQQMLETAAESASRLFLTGYAQTSILSNGHVGMDSADFKNAICNGASGITASGNVFTTDPLLPPMLKCSRLTVNVSRASAYSASAADRPTFTYDSSGNIVSTGTGYNYAAAGAGQNQIVAVQLIYLWPTGTGALGSSLINEPNNNRMLTATSVFTTEDYSCAAGQSTC